MKTIIYYFTGTGNSLAAARILCDQLGDCELRPIAAFAGTHEIIRPDTERVGIVCPVYDFGLPSIVAEFTRRLDVSGLKYLFGVLTIGGMGGSALRQLDAIFHEGYGRPLDAAFTLRMPGNFIPLYKAPKGMKRDEILSQAHLRLLKIAEFIREGRIVHPGLSPFTSLLKGIMYNGFIAQVHSADSRFTVSDDCTSCRTCESVCPVKNILMVNDRPAWQHQCELCLACLHLCPVDAIDWGSKTAGRARYRHPALKVSDMKAQRGEPLKDPDL